MRGLVGRTVGYCRIVRVIDDDRQPRLRRTMTLTTAL